MEIAEWYKLKRYPHIGFPLTIKDYKWVKEYVEDETCIKKHSFLPLIHKCIIQRKFRADVSTLVYNPSGKRKRFIGKPKIRNIYYASHIDSIIFSYYNYLLSDEYEKFIDNKSFKDSIVAYRKIPIFIGSEKNKCNIDFAKSTFEFINDKNDKPLSVIVADVTSFFDNLDHKILKQQWSKILNKITLPEHHYNVYKALTRIKFVESDQLFESYDSQIIVEKGVPDSSYKKQYVREFVKSKNYFKEKNAIAYCTKDEFLNFNLNLVISAFNKVGIPQGSPISATLANVYMLDFDQEVFDKINSIGGMYQRYSDDLIIVCEQQFEDEILYFIRDRIKNLARLEIHEDKTKVYRFDNSFGKFQGFEINEKTKVVNKNKTLEYLGFSYDGQRVLIKTSGFSKFYRSMKKSFKKSTSLALHSKNPDKSLFKSRLYKRFTHRGAKRKLIYRPSSINPAIYERTKKYYWGNYLSYIYKANDAMKTLNKKDTIKKQSNKFWRKFHLLMNFHESRLVSKK